MNEELERKERELKKMEEDYIKESSEIKTMTEQILKQIRKIDPRSLYIFDLESVPRQFILKILQHK
jgi:hypothetical protein